MTDPATAQQLDRANQFLAAGQRSEAYAIAKPITVADPLNAHAWYIVAQATENVEEAAIAREREAQAKPIYTQRLYPPQPQPQPQFYQQPVAYYPAPQQQQRHGNPLAVIALVICVGLLFAFFWPSSNRRTTSFTPSSRSSFTSSSPVKIVYKVETDAFVNYADITIQSGSGATEQFSTAKLPWTKTFNATPGQFVYVSAQLEGTGKITCTITADGKVVQTATSSGQYVIAGCSGTAR